MAKKNFKGGLDSLIENSLGIRKSGKKGEMRGNPIDLLPEQKENEKKEEKDFFFKDDDKKQTAENSKDAKAEPQASEAQKSENQASETQVSETQASEPQASEKEETAAIEQPEAQENSVPETQGITASEENSNEPNNDSATAASPVQTAEAKEDTVEVKTVIKTPTIEVEANDSEKNVFLKNMVADLRKELYLWRNGKINVQSFNATLHSHGLKYNPDNNEIEEF